MFYIFHLISSTNFYKNIEEMDFNAGDAIELIVILVVLGITYGRMDSKHKETERRLDILEATVNKLIDVDDGIKKAINDLTIQITSWQATITEQIKSLVDRLDRDIK